MKNIIEHTQVEISECRNEKKILPEDLIAELAPLVREFFVADFSSDKNTIKLSFFNGQTFNVHITE